MRKKNTLNLVDIIILCMCKERNMAEYNFVFLSVSKSDFTILLNKGFTGFYIIKLFKKKTWHLGPHLSSDPRAQSF